MSDHPWNDWRVTAYTLDELDEPARAAFERELATDPLLKQAVAEASRITRAVTASLGREPAPTLSDVHRAELFSHFSGENPMNVPAPNKRAGRRGRSGARLAIAASLCLVIGGAVALAIRVNTMNQLAERDASTVSSMAEHRVPLSSSGSATTSSDGGAIPYRYYSRSDVAEHVRYRDSKERVHWQAELIPPDEVRMSDEGRGPGQAGDRYDRITDNPFLRVIDNPLSTFSIDVDTASYSKVRQYLIEQNRLPRPDAVRIEELINYFDYQYEPPAKDAEHPFAASIALASCPWNSEHRLARIGIKGREVENDQRPPSNLVFLLDVSGSMNQPNKLPLVRRGMQLLLEQLGENDRVAIVVYAGAAGMVLDSTPADRRQEIFDAIDRLRAGGSTNGGQGIQLAYATARDHFISGGTNRVILCTDGDFNVGTTGTDQLVRIVEDEAKAGIFLTVLGFGMGNHNDAMLEQISGRGNGNYAFIDTENEARKVLVQQTAGTLVTIAKDVKIQVEFNPNQVAGYRLIGYENRLLAKEDFNDDTKDAGEIGAGHTVTALYEIVPAGEPVEPAAPDVDPLKYQTAASTTDAAESDEMLTLKLRYKQPDDDQSTLVEFPADDTGQSFDAADRDFQFAAAVAGFGMLLRDSPYKGNWTLSAVEEVASDARGEDAYGFRSEFLRMVRKAAEITGE